MCWLWRKLKSGGIKLRSNNKRLEAFTQAFKQKSQKLLKDDSAQGGIAGAMVGIVAVMLILNIIPMMLVPMQQASENYISSAGAANDSLVENWTAAFSTVKTTQLNAYSMMSVTPTVQTVVLILAVVLAVA